MNLYYLTASQLIDRVANREITCQDIINAHLSRIDALDPHLRALITLNRDTALAQAEELDRRRGAGEKMGALGGLPVVVKDNIVTKDCPTTCGSKILENFIPPYNATVVEKLLAADAIIIGKTNLDEFAMGSSTETSVFGPTRNPWDLERVPGGSSGGSIAAVASGMSPLGLGSETGGSVRQPASFCSVVGIKPSYGRVSRYGLVAYASSLDQIGPTARTVKEATLLLQVIAGHDPKDSTSAKEPVPDYLAHLTTDLKGLRIGVPTDYFSEGLDPEVEKAVRVAIARLRDLGAAIVEIRLPHMEYTIPAYYVIATAEASSNLARYDGVKFGFRAADAKTLREMYEETRRQGFGPEVKRRIMLGTYVLSAGYYDAYYKKAQQVRTLIKQDFDAAWQRCDVLATPTSPTTAFKIGDKVDDPLAMYLSDVYTVSANLAGVPALSVPCGFDAQDLPIGLQLTAPAFQEEVMLRAAYAYEQVTEWHLRHPVE